MQNKAKAAFKPAFQAPNNKVQQSILTATKPYVNRRLNPEIENSKTINKKPSLPKQKSTSQNTSKRPTNKNEGGLQKYSIHQQQPKHTFRPIMQPAPHNQFKIYLNDSENVFYQDSPNVKSLKRIKLAKIYLGGLFILLIFSYFLIGRIVAFPIQRCPKHAECLVFVNCHQGYVLANGRCIIDPNIINKAQQISIAVVNQLSLDYGNSQCHESEANATIYKKMREVFAQFQVEDDILKEQIANIFENKAKQEELGFQYIINTITPQKKQYSLSCAVQLFTKTSDFKYFLFAILIACLLMIYAIRQYIQHRKAQQIYQLLRKSVFENRSIRIDACRTHIQTVTGRWSEDLWIQVDKIRCKQAKIAYYIDEEQLHWRLIS